MKFKYSATTKKGKTVKGEITARTFEEVEQNLAEQGLVVLTIEEEKIKEEKGARFALFKKRVPLGEKILFFSNLASMLKAGLPVIDAIEVMKEGQRNERMKEIFDEIAYDIRGGETFSSSLAKFPDVFSMLDLSIFEVGETGGTLEQNVKTLADQLEKQKKLQSKVRSALMYPIVITIAMIGIGILLIVFVIPRIAGFFEEADLKLPITTRLLIGLSNLMINSGIFVAAGVFGLIFLYRYLYKNAENFRIYIDRTVLKIPFIGLLMRRLYIARFCRTLGSLLKSGVPIVQALDIVKKGFTNYVANSAISIIGGDIESGSELSEAMSKHKDLFYPMETRMIVVGSKTGTVDESLFNVANYYESAVSEVLDNLATIIEPVLLIVMGIGVAVIALSVLTPIYQLVGSISG